MLALFKNPIYSACMTRTDSPDHYHSGHSGHSHGAHPHNHHHQSGHDHHHDHGHGHHHKASRGLGVAFWLIAGLMVLETVGGLWSGSLALLADAGHMVVDTLSLALAYWAHRLTLKPASKHRSFGHSRTQVLAAFVNSLLLLGIVAAIIVEAINRLSMAHQAHVNAPIALAVASAGLLVNLIAAKFLHGHSHNLNMRAAYLHVLSDLAGSAAAMLAAGIIMTTGWLAADAWLSLLVTALIARGAWQLLQQSAHVLQEGTPRGFDAAHLEGHLLSAIPALADVHHVHAWSLNASDTLLTLHARLTPGADAAQALVSVKELLRRDYRIDHSTIQLEATECADAGSPCATALN